MEEPGEGAGLVTTAPALGKRMEPTLSVWNKPRRGFMCRGLLHLASTLSCCRDRHPPARAWDPQLPGRCWCHLAEARVGHFPHPKLQFPQLWGTGWDPRGVLGSSRWRSFSLVADLGVLVNKHKQ